MILALGRSSHNGSMICFSLPSSLSLPTCGDLGVLGDSGMAGKFSGGGVASFKSGLGLGGVVSLFVLLSSIVPCCCSSVTRISSASDDLGL